MMVQKFSLSIDGKGIKLPRIKNDMAKKESKYSFEQICAGIKAKNFAPVYFFCGEETFYIDQLLDLLEKGVLNEEEKAFNQSILYGRDVDAPQVLAAVKRYPMMAERQLVILKEAQDFKGLEGLSAYLASPMASTVFVMAFKNKKPDGRLAVTKLLKEKAVYLECDKMYDSKLPSWVMSFVKEKGYRIHDIAVQLLVENIGNDLQGMVNALNKLFILLPKGTEISAKVIEDNIGFSKDYSIFELQNALRDKDVFKANKIAYYFAKNEKDHPLVLTLGMLNTYFTKILLYHYLPDKSKPAVASALGINPFFVDDYVRSARSYSAAKAVAIVGYLRDYDLKSKGVGAASGASSGELLKELLFKILH